MKRIDVRGVPVLKMATDTKAQALKVLEEAAELVEAVKCAERLRGPWEHFDAVILMEPDGGSEEGQRLQVDMALAQRAKDAAIAEAADVTTATVGLLVAMGLDAGDICDAMAECAERQERRGRE